MTERTAQHVTFSIDRRFDSAPSRVFAAWAEPEAKARWFVGPPGEWTLILREHDFRVGGRECLSGRWPTGVVSAYDAWYLDIVPARRIVCTYTMHVDERKISVSLATVEFAAAGSGTAMVFTEQAAFLDGFDDAGGRERGTRLLLDRLAASLAPAAS